jgi:hypothetical protein
MDSHIFTNIMVKTGGSDLARKAVDSTFKLAQKTTPSSVPYMWVLQEKLKQLNMTQEI